MRAADYIVDVGPGAGVHGGYVVAQGLGAGHHRLRGVHHRPVPVREEVYPRARRAATRAAAAASSYAAQSGEQPQEHRRRACPWARSSASPACPARASRRSWAKIISKTPGRRAQRRGQGPARQVRQAGGTGASRQGYQYRPVAHWPHATLQSRHLHRAVHRYTRPVRLACPRARCAGSARAGSPSTSRAAAARPARATASSRSRCTSCRTSMCPVKSARASATTAKPRRSSTRARAYATCWT